MTGCSMPPSRLRRIGMSARADVLALAAACAHALTRNHPFVDGNKRVALTVAGVFMELNGFRLEASEQEAAHATRALSARKLSEAEFANWLPSCSSKLRTARRRTHAKATAMPRKQPKPR
jgi:prophage maintenance system killer protein